MRGKPKKGKRAMRRQRRRKRARFEEGSRFSGAKRTETGWADGVFLHLSLIHISEPTVYSCPMRGEKTFSTR